MAFIRLESRQHFEVTFDIPLPPNGVVNLNVPTNMPRYAEIKFPNMHLAAESFQFYRRSIFSPKYFMKINNFPTKNMIYILMSCGDIYRSKLIDWHTLVASTI